MPLRYCRTVTVTSAPRSSKAWAETRPIMPLPITRHRLPARLTPCCSKSRRAVWMTDRSAVVRATSVFTRFPAVTARRKSTSRVWSAA